MTGHRGCDCNPSFQPIFYLIRYYPLRALNGTMDELNCYYQPVVKKHILHLTVNTSN